MPYGCPCSWCREREREQRESEQLEQQEDKQHCEDCQDEHRPGEQCQREWCSDCDDWHERDSWGDITCPGWYCEDCDDHHDYGEDCPSPYCGDCGENHAPGECAYCYCEAPRQSFTVPNDGQPPLASDERATVHLAAGVITDEGLKEIRDCLQREAWRLSADTDDRDGYEAFIKLSYDLDGLGSQWQTRQGNFTKRLSRHAYQAHGIKITPEALSRVGNIAREHSTAADVDIEVTRNLNLSAEDFYHEDSCWWGSYGYSRCALKSNGGFGLRSFSPDADWDTVTGRAWVMPLRRDLDGKLAPTFDTEHPDALVVFNGYGDLAGYAAPRVIAAMYGWTYAKMPAFGATPMYVNAGGYLVGPEDIIQDTKSLTLDLRQHSSLYESELSHAA